MAALAIAGRSPWRADAGRLAREATIMTEDKARKIATRQRMAETGEPYSVARRAVEDEHDAAEDLRDSTAATATTTTTEEAEAEADAGTRQASDPRPHEDADGYNRE